MIAAAKKQKLKKKLVVSGFLLSMLIIPMVNFAVFWVYTNFRSIMLAFEMPDGTLTLENFRWFFNEFRLEDSLMIESLINTLIFFIVNAVVVMILSLTISYFIYKKIHGFKFFRIVFFIPSILSAVVLTTIFKNFIGYNGPLEAILKTFGATNIPEFLADSRYAMPTIVAYTLWTAYGTNIILFSGAMSRISVEVLESASLDGVGMFKEVTKIILPMIWPTVSTLMVFALAGVFSASGPILLFTKGNYGTMTISYWIFDQVNSYQSYWKASAAGLFYTVVGVPVTLIGKYLLEKLTETVDY